MLWHDPTGCIFGHHFLGTTLLEAANLGNLDDSQLKAAFDEAWSNVTQCWVQAHEDLSFSTVYDHLPK